jgi:predicted GH43/DUF377 family glycosyl hydrolase
MRSFLFVLLYSIPLWGLLDLEKNCSSFVFATKKIEIANFYGAFNPSIFEWKGGIYLSFRTRDPITGSTNKFGITALDDNLDPIGTPQIFDVEYPSWEKPSMLQDPRFCQVGDRLFVVFNNILYPPKHIGEVRKMFVAELLENPACGNSLQFELSTPEPLLFYPGIRKDKEKNWVPFAYLNRLLLAYSISPHRILEPYPEAHQCQFIAETHANINWKWGILRGGTQASQIGREFGNDYLAFFHSTKSIASVHSQGAILPHYFIGAYTFCSDPPFALSAISPKPIVGPHFYNGADYPTWKPLRVVYPTNYIWDDETIYLSYGRQDHEIWIAYIDRQALFKSLIPLSTP